MTRTARCLLVLIKFSAYLPLPLVHGFGVLLGLLVWLIPNAMRRVAAINIALCFPELNQRQQQQLLRRNLLETGKGFAELGPLWFAEGKRVMGWVREVQGEDLWQQALQNGKGVVALTPHLGAWELAGLYGSSRYPLTSLYRPSRFGDGIDEHIHHARERLGGTLVSVYGSGVRKVMQALRQGQAIGILPDQDPGPEDGMFTPFFGQQAATMVLLSRLVLKSQAAVFTIYAERLSWGRGYRIRVIPAPAVSAAQTVEASVMAVNQAVEQIVRQCPEQYLWVYKRFKSRPANSDKVY